MKLDGDVLALEDDDLRELFGLFTSCSRFEKRQLYDAGSPHHLQAVALGEEYSLTEAKRDYAIDSWRAVLSFLHRKGIRLAVDGRVVDLSWVEEHLFVQ